MVVAVRRKIWLADRQLYERYVRVLRPLVWLPLRDVSGSIARNAAYTVYTPLSPGPELLSNPGQVNGVGSLFAFDGSGNTPTGWTVEGETGADPRVSEVAAGQGNASAPNPGGGHINLYSGPASPAVGLYQPVLTVGDSYRGIEDIDTVISGIAQRSAGGAGGTNFGPALTAAGVHSLDFIAIHTHYGMKRAAANTNVTFNGRSVRKIGQLDALIGGTTSLGHPGLLGLNEACLFDGATSILTITNRASIQGLTAFTLWLLFNPASAGEGNAGVLFSKSGEFELRFNSASRDLIATVNYSTTNAVRVTNETLSVNDYHTVGMRINNTDKVPEIFIDGLEANYASTTVGVGARVSSTSNLIIGNNSAVSGTLSGRLDEALLADVALSAGELRQLHLLAG